MKKTTVHTILNHKQNIFSQLQIEEALLRTSDKNWCLVTTGTSPAVVLGISSKVHEMIHLDKIEQNPIPIIRRFSGGGTVVVDRNTIFITFIFNQADTPDVLPNPQAILEWAKQIYHPIFGSLPFNLRENDFVFDHLKCGGNALYLIKDRWLLHTSWLWDYDKLWMEYLKNPKRQPDYRKQRPHEDFLIPLKTHFSSKKELLDSFITSLRNRFHTIEKDSTSCIDYLNRPHRKTTKFIENPQPVCMGS